MEEFKKNIERFLPFLEDLRGRLYRGIILFVIFFVVGFFMTGTFLKRILSFIDLDQVTIATTSPFQYADLAMDVGFFLAVIVSVPYIIYSFYIFILPAITNSERKRLLKFIPLSVGLFILGFVYGFFILYFALEVLASININLGFLTFGTLANFYPRYS